MNALTHCTQTHARGLVILRSHDPHLSFTHTQALGVCTSVASMLALLLSLMALCRTLGGRDGCLHMGASAARRLADAIDGQQTARAPTQAEAVVVVKADSPPAVPPPAAAPASGALVQRNAPNEQPPPRNVRNLDSLRQPSAELLLSRLNTRATTPAVVAAKLPASGGPSTRATPQPSQLPGTPLLPQPPPQQPNFSPPLPSVSRTTPVLRNSASPRYSVSPEPPPSATSATMYSNHSCCMPGHSEEAPSGWRSELAAARAAAAALPPPVPAPPPVAAPPAQSPSASLPTMESLQPKLGSGAALPTAAQSDAAANLIAGLRAAAQAARQSNAGRPSGVMPPQKRELM